MGVRAVAATPLLLQKSLEIQRQTPNGFVLSHGSDVGPREWFGRRLIVFFMRSFRLRFRVFLGQLPYALQFGNTLLESTDIFVVFLLPERNPKPVSRSLEPWRLQKRC